MSYRESHLHLRGYLERQSDLAKAHRTAILQERARRHSNAFADRRNPDLGPGCSDSGCEHPPALSRHRSRRQQPRTTAFACDVSVRKGEELGWFEHGSTIIVLTPDRFSVRDNV